MALTSFRDFVISTASKKDVAVELSSNCMQYPTGFLYNDYAIGNYIVVYDDEEIPQNIFHNIGIAGGSYNTVISKSQGGKTTLLIKIAAAIIEPFINPLLKTQFMNKVLNPKLNHDIIPLIQILESEGTLDDSYVKKLTQYPNKILKNVVSLAHIDTDVQLMAMVNKHCRYKEQNMEKINMPMTDLYGNPIYTYPPTVIIIDSATDLTLSEAAEATDESYSTQIGNTFGMRRAKVMSAIVSKLNMIARTYNITIFSVNHINIAPQVSIVPQAKQYRGFKQGETLNGGERAIYLSSGILRLDVIKEIGTEKSSMVNMGDGVTGFISNAKWIKCKTNSKRNAAQLVYTNEFGYDPLLSNIWQAKEMGHLPKSGNFFYLPGLPQYKFTMKNVRSMFQDHPEMILELYDNLTRWCEPFLDNVDDAIKNDKKETKKYLEDSLKEDVQLGIATEQDVAELTSIYNDLYAS